METELSRQDFVRNHKNSEGESYVNILNKSLDFLNKIFPEYKHQLDYIKSEITSSDVEKWMTGILSDINKNLEK